MVEAKQPFEGEKKFLFVRSSPLRSDLYDLSEPLSVAADRKGSRPAQRYLFGLGQQSYIRLLTNDGKMGFDRSAAY